MLYRGYPGRAAVVCFEKEVMILEHETPESILNPNRWKIMRVTVFLAFMSSLDGSIVNIALPNLSETMNEPISSITWVVTSYLIALCALIPFFGRLGDIKGNTQIFKFGIAVFTFGSLLCGVSVNLTMLVISRLIQAIGAAAGMSTNQGIITRAFPPNERGRALGFNATSVAMGALLGPPLGGFIISVLSWHFLFLINLPIGLAVFLFSRRILLKDKGSNESLDVKGFVLFTLSAILIFGAIGSGENVQFSNPLVLAAIIAGLVLVAAFIIVERKQSQPMLDLSMFRSSMFSISIICAVLVYASMSSINLLQAFYLQNARGMGSFLAGLILMIYPVVLGAMAPLAGYLSDKIGTKIPTLVGLCISSVGYIVAAFMTLETSLVLTAAVYIILGVGNALFQSPNTALIMSSVPNNKLGVAGSVNAFARNTGMVFGVLLATMSLFAAMSARYGQPVNDYVEGRPDLFIYGMRFAYLVVAGVCFLGALLTALRLFGFNKKEDL